jgi:septum formation protein
MRIVLASTSPRRIELMKQLGFRFKVVPPKTDEALRKGESPRAMVARLAEEKAEVVAEGRDALVIAADTTVVSPDGKRILGKPVSRSDAERMLRGLSGRVHTVLTAYCITLGGTSLVRVVRSRVKMRKLSAVEVRRYVASGEPMDKAGSYAAQGLGMALIEEIRGSYTNVVGLPMAQLVSDLERFGIELFRWKR